MYKCGRNRAFQTFHMRRRAVVRRCTRKCTLLCVCVLLMFSMLRGTGLRVSALTNSTIRNKQAQIEATRKERSGIRSSLANVQQMKKELEASKSDLSAYITELDQKLMQIQANIEDLKAKIVEKEQQIEQTEKELEEAIRIQEEQYEAMKLRIKFIYEEGDLLYTDVLFTAKSFSDILNKATYVEKLEEYDRRKLEEYKLQVQVVDATRQALEEEKQTLDETKAGVEAEEASVQELMAEKEAQLAQVREQIATQEEAICQYEAQIYAQDLEIAQLEQQIEAEQKRLEEEARAAAAAAAAAARRHYTGGIFVWPCPSYSYISSDYGYRTHPIYGTTLFHSGIDMAASTGAPILAAATGQVVAASYSSSMGNYVMIDHGDNIYTVYMHCSRLYVSKGQEVAAGATIAAVGSTGASTGPHLHFSVRKDGQYVSPWPYLGTN